MQCHLPSVPAREPDYLMFQESFGHPGRARGPLPLHPFTLVTRDPQGCLRAAAGSQKCPTISTIASGMLGEQTCSTNISGSIAAPPPQPATEPQLCITTNTQLFSTLPSLPPGAYVHKPPDTPIFSLQTPFRNPVSPRFGALPSTLPPWDPSTRIEIADRAGKNTTMIQPMSSVANA